MLENPLLRRRPFSIVHVRKQVYRSDSIGLKADQCAMPVLIRNRGEKVCLRSLTVNFRRFHEAPIGFKMIQGRFWAHSLKALKKPWKRR
jgi:hypothetical protein